MNLKQYKQQFSMEQKVLKKEMRLELWETRDTRKEPTFTSVYIF